MIFELPHDWKNELKKEVSSSYFSDLEQFIQDEYERFTIYPASSQIFAAFNHTGFDAVKVVIIGQDPYHGFGQANGLCFSVSEGVKLPPSLQNIFKELSADLEVPVPRKGDLCNWAKQGVLLLNATLTVRESQPGSHAKKGWENFTNSVIRLLSEKKEGLVFLLWGKYAWDKKGLIDQEKHFVLEAPHPSPLSAYRGFFGCRHFSKTNKILISQGKEPINWIIE